MYFRSVFIKSNKVYINIFIINLMKNSQKYLLSEGPKKNDPLTPQY